MPRKASSAAARSTADARAKIPVIGYALLGRLVHQDQTGYELSQLMGPPKNFTWEANHSQIYPVLAVLTEAGYVTFSHVLQESKPNKKVYSLTEQGRAALLDWVRSAPTYTPTRNEFHLKVASLGLLAPQEAIAVLQRQIAMIEGEIETISALLDDVQARNELRFPLAASHELFGLYATVTFSKENRLFTLQWYRWMLSEFEKAAS